MDNSSAIWMSELLLETEDQGLNLNQQQYQMNNIDDALYDQESSFHGFTSAYPPLINGCTATHNYYFQSSGDVAESTNDQLNKPITATDSANGDPISYSSRTSSPCNIICFSNPEDQEHLNDSFEFSEGADLIRGSSSSSRSPLQAQDHVLNERKRRERMAKLFAALSAIIPNKKKMDKASILGEAMKYIKELQERVKELEKEEHIIKKDVIESFVLVKRARGWSSGGDDDVISSSEENSPTTDHGHHFRFTVPEIKVRVSGANVLVKIHCHKRSSGLLLKALEVIQKHRLSIVSSSAMPFAYSTLLIDIIAQMEDGDRLMMAANEVVEKLELDLYLILCDK